MKKSKNNAKDCGKGLKEKNVKKLVVKPLARRMQEHADRSLRQGRRSFKKIEGVEKLIEIIARQIKRQSDPTK